MCGSFHVLKQVAKKLFFVISFLFTFTFSNSDLFRKATLKIMTKLKPLEHSKNKHLLIENFSPLPGEILT